MTKKYDDSVEELKQLCNKHDVYLCAGYDEICVFNDTESKYKKIDIYMKDYTDESKW